MYLFYVNVILIKRWKQKEITLIYFHLYSYVWVSNIKSQPPFEHRIHQGRIHTARSTQKNPEGSNREHVKKTCILRPWHKKKCNNNSHKKWKKRINIKVKVISTQKADIEQFKGTYFTSRWLTHSVLLFYKLVIQIIHIK